MKSYHQEFHHEFASNDTDKSQIDIVPGIKRRKSLFNKKLKNNQADLKSSNKEIRRELAINKISKIDTDEDIFGSDNLSEFLLSKKANIIQKSPEGIM
jgi:hypothetical protein